MRELIDLEKTTARRLEQLTRFKTLYLELRDLLASMNEDIRVPCYKQLQTLKEPDHAPEGLSDQKERLHHPETEG